jgi:ribosomal protein S18 acetylase RimI-like enzyme
MTASDAQRALDNPIWSCLSTRHAHLSDGGALARRYRPAISPLAGFSGAGPQYIAELETVVDVGDHVGTAGPFIPALPAHWETFRESHLTQMIRTEPSLLPEGDVESSALGTADVPDMLALVELTRPGPFRPRTIELGNYIGIRERGQLVAMAGERLWIGDFREVSAVCTHPGAQGRGHARALIGRVVNRMLRAGQTPFLHVESVNTHAIDVYRTLGFVRRIELPLLYARRIG